MGEAFRPEISDYKLDTFELIGKSLYEQAYSLQEVQCSVVYEKIFDLVPHELYSKALSRACLPVIFKDKKFKILGYSNQSSRSEYVGELEELLYGADDKNKTEKINDRYSVFLVNEQKKIIVKLDVRDKQVFLCVCSTSIETANAVLNKHSKYPYKESKCEIGIILQGNHGVYVKDVSVDPVNIDVGLNYGESFLEKNKEILEKLETRKGGLYLFHGPPSGGKTSYIKFLAEKSSRKFIFVPTSLIESIESPSLITVLMEHPRAVLILEDAEKAIVSRKKNSNPSLVSSILNLSDGILSSMFGLSLIVTFNTKKEDIDPALVRKGRLFVEHEFKELTIEESQKVSKHLGKKQKIDKPMMLGDIYNSEDSNYHKEDDKEENKIIGFSQKI